MRRDMLQCGGDLRVMVWLSVRGMPGTSRLGGLDFGHRKVIAGQENSKGEVAQRTLDPPGYVLSYRTQIRRSPSPEGSTPRGINIQVITAHRTSEDSSPPAYSSKKDIPTFRFGWDAVGATATRGRNRGNPNITRRPHARQKNKAARIWHVGVESSARGIHKS